MRPGSTRSGEKARLKSLAGGRPDSSSIGDEPLARGSRVGRGLEHDELAGAAGCRRATAPGVHERAEVGLAVARSAASARGHTITWIDGVDPRKSVALLVSLIGRGRHSDAMSSLAMHADPSATTSSSGS